VRRRVLLLSWEYPPIDEGGLARHVRKLSEALAARGEEVHVLTRGRTGRAALELRAGVQVHRVIEPATPRDRDEASPGSARSTRT
jgi:glycogen(starch) synthase